MKTRNLPKLIMLLLISTLIIRCSNTPEEPIVITHENNKLYVYSENNEDKIDWQDAMKLCDDLDAFGYNDWYLPTIEELKIMNDSIWLGILNPYWSSTVTSDSSSLILLTGFVDRQIKRSHIKNNATRVGGIFYVVRKNKCRCVRKDN